MQEELKMERIIAQQVADRMAGYSCFADGPEFSIDDAMGMTKIAGDFYDGYEVYAMQKGDFLVWAEVHCGICTKVRCFNCEEDE